MTNSVFDASNPLPPETDSTNARVELADAGSALIDLDVSSDTLRAIQANLTQHILIAAASHVNGQLDAVELKGIGSSLSNEGVIGSVTGAGVLLSGRGTSTVTNAGSTGHISGAQGVTVALSVLATSQLDLFNSGTISADTIAVRGGSGNDHIVNLGMIETSASPGSFDLIDLGNGNDLYDGRLGSAIGGTIRLGGGNDTAFGGAGSETFAPGAGDNVIVGGDDIGVDTADYSDSSSGVSINLGSTSGQWTGRGWDTLLGIENLIGSTNNDTLIGGTVGNLLAGGDGDDHLEGGYGDDTLDGGSGTDTVQFSGFVAVTVDLTVAGAQNTGNFGSKTFIGVENVDGGAAADLITGDANANRLDGRGGNDTLKGGAGDDILVGGVGDDTAVFTGKSTEYIWTANGDGFQVADQQAGRDGTDTLKDIRFLKFQGDGITVALTNGAPTAIITTSLTVSENAAVGATVTTLFGSDPDGDTLTYSLVSDPSGLFAIDGTKIILTGALDFEAGSQHALSVKASDGYGGELVKTVTIKVSNVVETTPIIRSGTAGADQLVGESGNDRLSGLNGNDFLYGEGGNDVLIGGKGNDQLSGFSGNDTLYGGAGKDTLIGGAGKDVFVLDTKPTPRTIDYIYDFSKKDHDIIDLSRKAFSKLGRKGVLAKGAFVVSDHFGDANDRILYLKKSGALFYDPDGSGPSKAIQIATIGKNLALKYSDFHII